METTKEVKTIDHVECPFIQEYNSGKTTNLNGRPIRIAVWNLILSKRDLSLFTKCGMKINRSWSVTNVKKYFGIKGTGQTLMDNFMKLYNQIPEIVEMNTQTTK